MRKGSLFVSLVLALGLAVDLAVSPTATAKPDKVEIGKEVPDFELKDVYGKTFKLSEFRGKTVVLEWMNQDCPVWRGKLKDLNTTFKKCIAKSLKTDAPIQEKDMAKVVWFCVDSTHYMSPERNIGYAAMNDIARPILMDPDGKVGHMLGAKTTPHMFVIDPQGKLVYDGAIDDRGKTNYVFEAVEAVLAGKKVSTPTTKPYGCGVKYARQPAS